jgi:hypothetical protein
LIDYKKIKENINCQIISSSLVSSNVSQINDGKSIDQEDILEGRLSIRNSNKYGDGIGKLLLNSRRIVAESEEKVNIKIGNRPDRSITPVNLKGEAGYKGNEALGL